MKRTLIALALAGFGCGILTASAQQKDAAKPAPKAAAPAPKAEAKKEEEPFWAVGRPKGDATAKMAPVPALPIATAADQLPVKKIKLPPGFKVEVYQAGVLDARGMREGDKGTIFVSSLFVAGKIYAITNKGGKRELKTIAEKLFLPNGIEFYKGALYVATPKDITPCSSNTATWFMRGASQVSEMDWMTQMYVPAGEFQMGAAITDTLANDDERPQKRDVVLGERCPHCRDDIPEARLPRADHVHVAFDDHGYAALADRRGSEV
jgi:hypothetical protein